MKTYTKQELGLLYFPDSTPAVASAHLMRWIGRNTELSGKLRKSGYTKSSKVFWPTQVKLIIEILGEPDDFP